MHNTSEQILEVIRMLVCDLFGAEPDSICLHTRREEVAGWDSLQHVNLVIDIERHFRIRLTEADVSSIETVGDLVGAVQAACHVAGKG